MFDYAEARIKGEYTVFTGLQYILKKYMSTIITMDMVNEAKMYADIHGIPFEYTGWSYIANELSGKLPIKIRSVKEGSKIPTKNVLFTVESTDKNVPWVASWAETTLMRVWYTSNVATTSYKIKQVLMEYANKTQDNPDVLLQFHNFGSRGSSSSETAALGGMAHLTQFLGSDNFHSIKLIRDYYKGNVSEFGKIALSIPGSEHSAVTSWTKDKEFDMVESFIEKNKGRFIMACVADSYDYYNFVNIVTGTKRFIDKIDSDEYPIFVIRPDSGNPEEVIPKTIDIMEQNNVPYIVNNKGFKVWNKFRLIWGDGIHEGNIRYMLSYLKERGYSSENIAFGMGGGLMQGNDETSNNRDTQGWAIKCSSITLADGTEVDVFKDPITAKNKKSKKGRITTYYNPTADTYFVDIIGKKFDNDSIDILETVFENGVLVKEYSIDEIRANS